MLEKKDLSIFSYKQIWKSIEIQPGTDFQKNDPLTGTLP